MPDPLHSTPARAAALLAAALLLAPAAAHAYIDPGTGSFVIQGIIAAVVGAGVALKMFWGRITGALGGKRRPADDDDDA
ncbi:MAG: hypothetical protein ABR506_05520 [Candidatus Krumholzibacteriia bacterium]